MKKLKEIIRKHVPELLSLSFTTKWSEDGNRSSLRPDYSHYLKDPQFLRYVTEVHSTGYFTGHLVDTTPRERDYINYLRASLEFMQANYPAQNLGAMWSNNDKQMLSNILQSDMRYFNHVGSLSYKIFSPTNPSVEWCVVEVLRTLCLYDYLSSSLNNFDVLHTNLNSGYLTKGDIKLNSKLKSYEEYLILKKLLANLTNNDPSGILKVMEIGWGEGQLANIILNQFQDKVKWVVIDLPSMHSRAPYFLFKCSNAKVCTYLRFVELGADVDEVLKEYDVLLLPPWEKEQLMGCNFDLTINMRSLCEMSSEEANDYIKLIRNNSNHLFSINTNKNSYDAHTQGDLYPELNILDLFPPTGSGFEVLETGATIGDSLFQKNLHHVYAILRKSG